MNMVWCCIILLELLLALLPLYLNNLNDGHGHLTGYQTWVPSSLILTMFSSIDHSCQVADIERIVSTAHCKGYSINRYWSYTGITEYCSK